MMESIGFLAAFLILCYASYQSLIFWIFVTFNPFGEPMRKAAVFMTVVLILIGYLWVQLFTHAPFTVQFAASEREQSRG